ncbi:MAG: NAD-dependent epimerase/dehydratase family protein [Actinomycetota bacterium]
MNVLVTGGAGFIGSHVVRSLLARGDRVRVLDALTAPVHVPGVIPDLGAAEFLHGDVRTKPDWARALDGIDAVVHMAAYQDYMPDFSRFFTVNAAGTALCYEVIVERGLPVRRVVVASSQSVYGEGAARCAEHGVVVPEQRAPEDLVRGDWDVHCPRCGGRVEPAPTSEDMVAPRNSYGISKLAAETAALALGAQHGIPTAALRYAIVHGPGQSPHNAYSGLLRSACLQLLAGRAPVVFEDGRQLRDYVAIDDAVSATLVALDHAQAPGRAYNVGGPRSLTVLEVLETLNEIVDVPRAPEIAGRYRVGDVRHTIGDLSRLRGLGWEPRTDLRRTWTNYVKWLESTKESGETVAAAHADMRARGVLRDAGEL